MTLHRRLVWAKKNLAPHPTDYRVVFEAQDGPCQVLIPDPNFMAAAMRGGILPPIRSVLKLKSDEKGRPLDYGKIHEADPCPPMTEEQAIEYLVMKDIPRHVWAGRANRRRFVICTKDQIPQSREFRDAWRLA